MLKLGQPCWQCTSRCAAQPSHTLLTAPKCSLYNTHIIRMLPPSPSPSPAQSPSGQILSTGYPRVSLIPIQSLLPILYTLSLLSQTKVLTTVWMPEVFSYAPLLGQEISTWIAPVLLLPALPQLSYSASSKAPSNVHLRTKF